MIYKEGGFGKHVSESLELPRNKKWDLTPERGRNIQHDKHILLMRALVPCRRRAPSGA